MLEGSNTLQLCGRAALRSSKDSRLLIIEIPTDSKIYWLSARKLSKQQGGGGVYLEPVFE